MKFKKLYYTIKSYKSYNNRRWYYGCWEFS